MFELYIDTLSFKLLPYLFSTPAVAPFPVNISVNDRVFYYNVTWNEPVSDFLYTRKYIFHNFSSHKCLLIGLTIIIWKIISGE